MSFGDIYQQPPGAPPLPGPPVELPTTPGPPRRPPTRLTITRAPKSAGNPDGAWGSQVEDYRAPTQEPDGAWAAAQPDHSSQRQVGTGEAVASGIANSATFGLAPAMAGAMAAGEATRAQNPSPVEPEFGTFLAGIIQSIGGHPDPGVRDAYERGRQAALGDEQLAKEQHPWAYTAGQLGGAIALPLPGIGAAANVAGRATRGAIAGGIGGGLYGAGSAVSQGEDIGGIGQEAAIGAGLGAPLGGLAGAVLGPRIAGPLTPGQQAAQTAEAIGAPIPKGVASDSRAIRGATAATASLPIAGARINNALNATREAAGGAVRQSNIDIAIAANRGRINALYDNVRNQIDQNATAPMPRTTAVLRSVKAQRQAAGWSNPSQGLEQFENIAPGATFNGAHRARVDAREAGDVPNPHAGYNASDFNLITRAMTADLRDMVGQLATRNPARAQRAFDEAEKQFGPMAEANRTLAEIAKQPGLGVGLDKIGFNPSTGEFSLDKFVTEWNKLNPQARPFVPEPAHAANIEAIFQMGSHIKSSMKERSTSHSAGPLIMLDLARDAILTGAAMGAGAISVGSVAGGAALSAPAILFAHWLASPATAAAMGAWARAYRAVTVGHPAPARLAVFNIATRNLANNLGIPAQQIMQRIAASPADVGNPDQMERPGPIH